MSKIVAHNFQKTSLITLGVALPCLTVCSVCFAPVSANAQYLTGNWQEYRDEQALKQQQAAEQAVHKEPAVPRSKPAEIIEAGMKAAEEETPSRSFNDIIAEPVPPSSTPQPLTPVSLVPPRQSSREDAMRDDQAPALDGAQDQEPVDLQADELYYDEGGQVITARGHVVLKQAGRTLTAEEVSYNLAQDKVVGRGSVSLTDINGDVHLADEVEFEDQLKDGFVEGLQSFLVDGSRFSAREGERRNATKTIMRGARYTPCEPCMEDLDADPVWQIKAAKVTHDEIEHRISYTHARFEVYGVPVAYVPYFSHADGTIDRKSGFLAPSLGYKSDLGGMLDMKYYWAIAPDKDATLGAIFYTDEDPVATAEWRQRWGNASLKLNGSATESKRDDTKGVAQEKEFRGHIFGEGLWDINNKWRAGVNIQHASDDRYLRQYDFSSEDVLENEIYAERFSGRNYAAARLLSFQDVRVREAQEDQPDVLPELVANFMGEPDSVPLIGGRWSLENSFLGLQRGGDKQDVNRASVKAGWQKRLISDFGLVTSVDTTLQGDLYNTRDRDIAFSGSGRSRDTTEARIFPQAHIQASYPMIKTAETYQARIEPIVAVTSAPNVDVNDDIPNEDSQDVQIDASNIFEPSRFPGIDRLEDKSHVTYGMKTGLYGFDGSQLNLFLGQSYRFDDDDNPFPQGSGLDRQESDIVGQVSGQYKDIYSLDYRFQLASRNLSSQRHEVDASADWNRFYVGSRYLFAKALEGTGINESREQIRADAGYYIVKDWRARVGATHDLGEDQGLREAYVGLDHFGQCVSWTVTAERKLTNEASGDNSTEILFRIGLKNLGEFETSGLRDYTGRE